MGVCLSAGFLAVDSGSRTCVFWHPSASKQRRDLVLNVFADRFPRGVAADDSIAPSKTFEGVSCRTPRCGKTSMHPRFQLRFGRRSGVFGGQRMPTRRQAYLPTLLPPSGRPVSINQ